MSGTTMAEIKAGIIASGMRELTQQVANLTKERDEARAECAAMREALEKCVQITGPSSGVPMPTAELVKLYEEALTKVASALSGTAGRDLLDRLAKLEEVAEAARNLCGIPYPEHLKDLEGELEDTFRALDEVKP